MATEESQFLSELAKNPNAVHKASINRYRHFVNAIVYLTCGQLKRADAVKQAQDNWNCMALKSEEYEGTMKLAEEMIRKTKARPIELYFKVQVCKVSFYNAHLPAITLSSISIYQ